MKASYQKNLLLIKLGRTTPNPLETGLKLNEHKIFRRHLPGGLLDILCTFNLRLETKKESVQFRMVQIKLLRIRLQNNSVDYFVKGYYSFKANFLSLSLRVTKWKWWETQIHVSRISENARRVLSNLWFKERVLQEVQHTSM